MTNKQYLCDRCGHSKSTHPNPVCAEFAEVYDVGEMIMVHLHHPCLEIDVWPITTVDERDAAIKQGYIPLNVIRENIGTNIVYMHPGEKGCVYYDPCSCGFCHRICQCD